MNKNKLKSVFLFCILIASAFKSKAQTNDAGLWLNVGIEKKISKKLTAAIAEELRFNENITELGTAFTEVGVSYKPIKNLSVGLAYRFIQKRQDDDFYSLRQRCMIDAAYKIKFDKWTVALRERLQTEYRDINSSPEGGLPIRTLRSKLSCKYDLDKKITPFASAEIFYDLNNPAGNVINNLRCIAGAEYQFDKKNSMGASFILNKELNKADPVTQYIASLTYLFSF